MKFYKLVVPAAFIGLLFSVSPATNVDAKPKKGSTAVHQGPIYDPDTGSYFELRLNNYLEKRAWKHANSLVSRNYYKGRKGRLAVIPDMRTLKFIRDKFRINSETWIGLRYFCKFRKLLWVNGEIHPLRDKSLWSRRWDRYQGLSTHPSCNTRPKMPYMSVYLTSESDVNGGVLLQAVAHSKQFDAYLVEYPKPEESKRTTDSERKTDPKS